MFNDELSIHNSPKVLESVGLGHYQHSDIVKMISLTTTQPGYFVGLQEGRGY